MPHEIASTVEIYKIPFVSILEQKREHWSMFRGFLENERGLGPVRYSDQNHLLELLAEEVMGPGFVFLVVSS